MDLIVLSGLRVPGTQRIRTQREADGRCRSCSERGDISLVRHCADFGLLLEVPSGLDAAAQVAGYVAFYANRAEVTVG